MAIFQFQMQLIKRADGRSAVSAAAYRSAEKIENEYTGLADDYSRKQWVEYKEVLLPDNAPPEYQDRGQLWNAVEKAEKSRDARLAREIEVALPQELSMEENIALARAFAQDFQQDGMAVDLCVHNPPLRDKDGHFVDNDGNRVTDEKDLVFRNPHAHLLLTVRSFDENGNWMPKTQKEYICKRDGETAAFTASEYAKAKADGWEKMYAYWHGKEKVWKTPSEAFAENLVRISKNPRSSMYGRRDKKMEFWNSPEALMQYRKSWETHVNRALEMAGRLERVDCRSYEAQGKDTVSGIHLGSYAAKHSSTSAYRINEEIKSINQVNQSIRKTIQDLEVSIQEKEGRLSEGLAEHLGKLEADLASAHYSVEILEMELRQLHQEQMPLAASVKRIQSVQDAIREKDRISRETIARLQAGLPEGALSGKDAFMKTETAIQAERDAMAFRSQRLAKILEEEGFSDLQDFRRAASQLEQIRQQEETVAKTISSYKQCIQDYTRQYERYCQYLPKDAASMAHFQERRQHWSSQYAEKAADHLKQASRSFQEHTFRRILRETRYGIDHTFYLAGRAGHLLHQMKEYADEQFDGSYKRRP